MIATARSPPALLHARADLPHGARARVADDVGHARHLAARAVTHAAALDRDRLDVDTTPSGAQDGSGTSW
jgi:hypothetical protein